MTLTQYLAATTDPARELAKLAAASGVSYSTLRRAAQPGGRIATYTRAAAVSRATGGKVSIEALCGAGGKRAEAR